MSSNDVFYRFPVRIDQTQVGMATLFTDGRFLIDPFYSDDLFDEVLTMVKLGQADGITIKPNIVPGSLPEVTKHDE